MARFLSIVSYKVFPARFGGQKGVVHFMDELGRHVDLTCLCSTDNAPDRNYSFQIVPTLPASKSQGINPVILQRIKRYILHEKITHVIIEHSYYGLLGKWLRNQGIVFIIHAHNIEFIRFRESGRRLWPLMRWIERRGFLFADHVLFKTKNDQEVASSLFRIDTARCHLLPYGTTLAEPPAEDGNKLFVCNRHGITPDHDIIFFSGTLDYQPNAMAYRRIAEQIIPLFAKKYKRPFLFIVCGRILNQSFAYLRQIRHDKLVYAGNVDDIEPYFLAASLFINPVTSGSGIQTKNIEAIAHGLPLVVTPFASQGIPPYLSASVQVSDGLDWKDFTDKMVRQLETRPATEPRFYRDFHWSLLTKKLLDDLEINGHN